MTIDPSQYARWRASPLGSTTEALEQSVVFDLAGPLSGKRVLDVGCGDGTYTLGAAERGAQVVGIDTSSEMVAASKRRASEKNVNIELLIADVTTLPFAAARFDVVLAVTVLCFVADVNIAVRELVRVLVPGGRVVLGELGRRSTWAAWRGLRGWLGSRAWRAATFRTAAELRTLVEQAGLSVEQVRGSIYYPPVMSLARWMTTHNGGGELAPLAAVDRSEHQLRYDFRSLRSPVQHVSREYDHRSGDRASWLYAAARPCKRHDFAPDPTSHWTR